MEKRLTLFVLAGLTCAGFGPDRAAAVCPSGLTNQIFCDDMDWYCTRSTCGADPSLPCPPDGSCPKSVAPPRAVWPRTGRDCGGNIPSAEAEVSVEDTLEVFSEPFGLYLPVIVNNAGQLAHTTVSVFDDIQNVHGTPAVIATDANPLIVSVNLQNQTGARVYHHPVVFEVSYGADFANTDFVARDCAPCPDGTPSFSEWAHVICAQHVDTPIPGCPDPNVLPPPIRKSIAAGYMSKLDTDPCYENAACAIAPKNDHLSYFDGRIWWKLTEGLFPGSGTFTVYDNLASMKLTIMSTTVKIEYWSYNETTVPNDDVSQLTVREYSVATAPRQYLDEGVSGAFDTLHAGTPPSCRLSDASADPWGTCVHELANWRCRRPQRGLRAGGRQGWDDFVFAGGEPYTPPPQDGACCLPTGVCAQLNQATCEAQGGTYNGDRLPCGAAPCWPACGQTVYADANSDNDVDVDDFGEFQKCFNPAGVGPGCACFDRGHGYPDGKIDLADFEAFQACATGANVPFVAGEHPNCPPPAGQNASMWYHEDFESYKDELGQPSQAAFDAAWTIVPNMGAALDLWPTGGNDGPQCIYGSKADPRRHYHILAPHIDAAPGGAGKTTVNGTDDNPLGFYGAYKLELSLDVAQQQTFFWDLALGDDMAPRGFSGTQRECLAFGAFSSYPGEGVGRRPGLMFYNGQTWYHLTELKHGTDWNYLTAVVRTNTVEITYYDQAQSNGVQKLLVSRVYQGAFDRLGINSDECQIRVHGADGFKLSGGVFLP